MRIPKACKAAGTRCSSTHQAVLRSMTARQCILKLEDLPDEMILHILKFLHLPDLLSAVQLNTRFKRLIENTRRLWSDVSLVGRWPSEENIALFERVAAAGNVEAMIKLAQAYLYKEGVSEENNGQSYEVLIGRYFSEAESCSPSPVPFTWLFIRPPWSPNGMCRKAKTFLRWKKQNRHKEALSASVLFSMAKIQSYFVNEDGNEETILQLYQQAADQGFALARHQLWEHRWSEQPKDAAHQLESIRQLRDIAAKGCLESQLRLYSEYAKGNFGDLSRESAMESTRRFFQSSRHGINYPTLFNGSHSFTNSMRYILLDWLVEVATLKDFSSQTIHMVVNCVDRYLSICNVTRCQLQLVGITCMIICARLEEDNIITIREAAWLTDGTYKYVEVVRMMGDIVATLRGNLKQLTIVDYLDLLIQVQPTDKKCEFVARYIAELSLLHAYFGTFQVSRIAASCLFLARVMTREATPWPSVMTEFTGLTLSDLSNCVLALQRRCFQKAPIVDHRDVELSAVRQRYTDGDCCFASTIPPADTMELHLILSCEEKSRRSRKLNEPTTPSHRRKKDESLSLMSPSRKSRRTSRSVHIHEDVNKGEVQKSRVATPTQELSEEEEVKGQPDTGVKVRASSSSSNPCDVGHSSGEGFKDGVGKKSEARVLRSGPCRAKLQDIKNRVVNVEVNLRSSPRSLKRKTMES